MAHTLRNSRAGWAFWLALLVAAVVGSMTAQRPEVAIQQPKLIQKVEPEYPSDGVRSRLEGKVLIRFTVDTAGVPRDLILVESSHPVFIEPAMAAVRQWRFEPGRVSGKPYDLPALAELRFQASKAGSGAASEERRDSLGPKVMDPTTPAQVPTPHPGSKESVSSSGAVAEIAKKTNERDVEFFDTRITGADGAFRLRTENFFLVSDLKDDDQLGQVLLALERARSLFVHLYGKVGDGAVPVIVRENLVEIQKICRTVHGVGCYKVQGGRPSIVLSKKAFANGTTAPSVHEYTHLIQHEMGYDLSPAWVREGIAGYYENIEFKKDRLYIGYYDPRRALSKWLHAESVLTMDYQALGRDSSLELTRAFYAQSHLLIHMLRHT